MALHTTDEAIAATLYRLPLTYCGPVIYGLHPDEVGADAAADKVHIATITLLSLDRPLGVTNHHVLAEYRDLKKEHRLTRFQALEQPFNPEERLISASEALDLAVFDLTGFPITGDRRDNVPGPALYTPAVWPPDPPVAEGDRMVVGGYPKSLRRPGETADALVHGSLSFAGVPVVDKPYPALFSVHVDPDALLPSFAGTPEEFAYMLDNLGGVSGSPVFRDRGAADGPVSTTIAGLDLVGIVFETTSSLGNRLRCAQVSNIATDGTIIQ